MWPELFILTALFVEGYGGRFGDIGGGVALEPYWGWIHDVTGLAMIPEPGTILLLLIGMGWVMLIRRGKRDVE